MAGDAVTYEQMRDLLREQATMIRGSSGNSGGGAAGGGNAGADRITGAIGTTVDLFGKLATGTASTRDALSTATTVLSGFKGVGETTGKVLGTFGGAILDVNSTLKETGKYGINFSQNLGEANKAVLQAQYTMPEFQEAIRVNGKSLSGLAGGQNESAKTFLGLARDLQGTTVAQDLKAAGMSSQELNDVLLLTSRNSFRVNMDDVNARKEAVAAAASMANEMNKVADLTGKSRKQQEDEIRRIQERADVEAAVLLKQKTDPNFGKNMDAATQAMSRFGPKVQELLAEEATGGARSQDAIKTKAALGPAAEAIAQYGKALETGNADLIAEAKKKAEIAVSERVNSEEFLKSAKVTQGNVLNMGDLVHGSFQYQKNIAAEQEELAKQGKEATKEAAEASLAAKNEARTRGEKIDPKTGEKSKDEGAVLGRTINQLDNLGKVVGGTMANQFNTLNNKIGSVVADSLPKFDAKLKEISAGPEALKTNIQKLIDTTASTAGAKPAATTQVKQKASDLVKEGPGEKPIKQQSGSKDVFGDWFSKDWGGGGLSELHGKEAVVPEGKLGEFMRDMGGKMPSPEKMTSGIGDSFSKLFSGFDKSAGQQLPDVGPMANDLSKAIQSSLSEMTTNMPQLMSETFSKATTSLQQPDTVQRERRGITDTQENPMTEVVKLLEMLNKQMGELISHTSDVADLSGKQVKATRGLSGNRLAV